MRRQTAACGMVSAIPWVRATGVFAAPRSSAAYVAVGSFIFIFAVECVKQTTEILGLPHHRTIQSHGTIVAPRGEKQMTDFIIAILVVVAPLFLLTVVLGALPSNDPRDEKMQWVCRTILVLLFGVPILFAISPHFVLISAGIAL